MTSDKISQRFCKSLFTLTDLLRERSVRFNDFSPDYTLTIQQLRLLRVVEQETRLHNPAGMMLKTVAEALGVTPAAVSGMVDGMVQKGMLERTQDPEDRRSVRIKLTKSVLERIVAFESALGAVAERMAASFGPDRFEKITAELESMAKHLDETVSRPEEAHE